MGRKNNVKKLRTGRWQIGDVSYYGPIYEGKIYPLRKDSTYIFPEEVRQEFDKMIQADSTYLVDLNNLPVEKTFPDQTLDNVRHARLKPIKDKNGKYSIRASKLWDYGSPNIGTIGDVTDFLTKIAGGNKYVLEQTIPVKFDKKLDKNSLDGDWHLVNNTIIR